MRPGLSPLERRLQGPQVKVDHERKTITGHVYVGRPGQCPHSHQVFEHRPTGRTTAAGAEVEVIAATWPCTGEAGHFADHADVRGRSWSTRKATAERAPGGRRRR